MKNLLLSGFLMLFLIACNNEEKRYTQQSPEIDTYKQVIADYENQDWDQLASHYADTVKIMNNATDENAQSLDELIAQNKEDASLFTGWEYEADKSEYEMVKTDEGSTWVNFWGVWQGTLKANNKTYEIPTHITAQFVDGKIVKEYGYWDISKIMMDIQNIQQNQQDTLSTEASSEQSKPQ